MTVPTFSITCTYKALIAPDVYELHFEKPKGFTFRAGQFVLFDVPLAADPSDVQTRAYSIASAPHEASLIFVIKLVPGGRASAWIEKVVDTGSQIIMKGPFGVFTIPAETEGKGLLLVATGTGIAPFRSQILWLLNEQKSQRELHVIFGVRNEEELFWMETLSSLSIEHKNYHFHPTLTGEAPAWQGNRGRVYETAPRIIADFTQYQLLVCGAPHMVQSVKSIALTQWGMDKKSVHVEGFI